MALKAEDTNRTAREEELRGELVALLVDAGELSTPRVRDAMLRVPRHRFVAAGTPLDVAYTNNPLPIGFGQTISEPSVVALMTEAIDLHGGERVLEIGTGSGYQAAILSLLAAEVYTIELVPELAEKAQMTLAALGYTNVHVRAGDGYLGWKEHAPFDRVLLTAAPPAVPRVLVEQLAEEGVLVAPVGPEDSLQKLVRVRKARADEQREDLGLVQFVPMIHERDRAWPRHGPPAREWNVVATVREREFARALQILRKEGRVGLTRFHNVLVVEADDARALLEHLEARAATDPHVRASLARVLPIDHAFACSSFEELDARARAVLVELAPSLAGKSFHARLHHRGLRGASSRFEEQVLNALVVALTKSASPARVDFTDPDVIIAIETVGGRAGVSSWTRDDRRRFPLLHLD